MTIDLAPGESLRVRFKDADGEFLIAFDAEQYPNRVVVQEMGGLPGNVKGGANEILYCEQFGDLDADLAVTINNVEVPVIGSVGDDGKVTFFNE